MKPAYSILWLTLFCTCAFAQEWENLEPIPNQTGVAGAFAGVSHNNLLVAGGANFPDRKPWDGGKKVWHEDVYVLESPEGKWKLAGKLPRPLAYGISASYKDQLLCVGGCDANKHFAEVIGLSWHNNQLAIQNYPPLPVSIANGCGTLWENSIIIIGGQSSPTTGEALASVHEMDLSQPRLEWKNLPPLPGEPRILATVATHGESLLVIGGVQLLVQKDGSPKRKYLQDAYCFHRSTGWKRLPDVPEPLAAAPSPAPVIQSTLYLFGGDNGAQVNAAPTVHTGFSKRVLTFDLQKQRWQFSSDLPAPRVTVPCVSWENSWIVPSGEMRPGIRSPEVWRFTPPSSNPTRKP